jgi:hypothetical protein
MALWVRFRDSTQQLDGRTVVSTGAELCGFTPAAESEISVFPANNPLVKKETIIGSLPRYFPCLFAAISLSTFSCDFPPPAIPLLIRRFFPRYFSGK